MPPLVVPFLFLWPLLPLGAVLERLEERLPVDEEEQWRLEQNRLRARKDNR